MWKLLSSSCARWDVKHTVHQSFNIKLYTQEENISMYSMYSCPCSMTSPVIWCPLWALNSLLLRHLNHSNTWVGHPIRMQLKSDFCCDRHGQWGHASALAALQRLGRWLSLGDGFRGREEAPSRQPDASKTLLHTFHLSTAWPRHEGIQMKRMGSTVVCGISILFKMTFDMYLTYLIQLYYGFSRVTECFNRTSFRLPESHFHSLSKFLQHHSNCTLSVLHAWSKGFVAVAHLLGTTICNHLNIRGSRRGLILTPRSQSPWR